MVMSQALIRKYTRLTFFIVPMTFVSCSSSYASFASLVSQHYQEEQSGHKLGDTAVESGEIETVEIESLIEPEDEPKTITKPDRFDAIQTAMSNMEREQAQLIKKVIDDSAESEININNKVRNESGETRKIETLEDKIKQSSKAEIDENSIALKTKKETTSSTEKDTTSGVSTVPIDSDSAPIEGTIKDINPWKTLSNKKLPKRNAQQRDGGKSAANNRSEVTNKEPNASTMNSQFTGAAAPRATLEAAPIIPTQMRLFVGELKLLRGLKVTRVAIGNGAILKAKTLPGDEVLIIAEQEGVSSLSIWDDRGDVHAFTVTVYQHTNDFEIHEKTVNMRVKIVEFRESALRDVGINWQKSTSGPGLAFAADGVSNNYFQGSDRTGIFSTLPNNLSGSPTYFGIASEISSTINYLQQSGDAVTLAEPMLNCLSGGKASFLAGGEVPYPVTNAVGATSVQFKNYGIQLEIEPVVDSYGRISASIVTEVSQIDSSVTVLGAPGFLTRRTETELNVQQGQTIVISGLVSQNASQDIETIPGLGNIPILGELFKSRNFQKNLTQLVIFVTPEVVNPAEHTAEYVPEIFNEDYSVNRLSVDAILEQGLSEVAPAVPYSERAE